MRFSAVQERETGERVEGVEEGEEGTRQKSVNATWKGVWRLQEWDEEEKEQQVRRSEFKERYDSSTFLPEHAIDTLNTHMGQSEEAWHPDPDVVIERERFLVEWRASLRAPKPATSGLDNSISASVDCTSRELSFQP